MAPVKETSAIKLLPREVARVLREFVLPLKRRVKSHDEHIRHLLVVSKDLRRELDALKEDLSKTKQRIEWGEEA
jgi:hypothetical protein